MLDFDLKVMCCMLVKSGWENFCWCSVVPPACLSIKWTEFMLLVLLGWGWDPQPYKNRILKQVCVIFMCCVFLHPTWFVGVNLPIHGVLFYLQNSIVLISFSVSLYTVVSTCIWEGLVNFGMNIFCWL